MKKIISLLFLGFILASCSQDILENSLQEKGKEVAASFSLNVAPMNKISCGDSNTKGKVDTRSVVTSTIDDEKITDVWIVQFDNAGNYMKKEYFKDFKGSTIDARLAVNATGTTSTVYIMTNIGSTLADSDSETEFKTKFRRFYDESEMLLVDPETGKKCVPMLGVLTGVTVTSTGFLEKIDVTLKHILSKIIVKYTIPSTANFSIESIRLRNVPTAYRFATPPTATSTATSSIAVIDFAAEPNTTSTGTLVYYVPENQKGEGSNTDAAKNERMKEGIGTTNATYVELSGHIIGTKAGDKIVYSFYPGTNNYNDYNIVRNTEYTMEVTLDGTSASDRRIRIPERANCYLMKPNTTIEIPVMRANESDLGVQLPDATTGWTASIVWMNGANNLISVSNLTKSKGYFTVTAPSATNVGNALVCIKDGSGNILWSWHIWVDDEDPTTDTSKQISGSGFTWMDRNIGATESGQNHVDFSKSSPLLFQWGRKDPFFGTTNTSDPATGYYTVYDGAGTAFSSSNTPSYTPLTTTAVSSDYMTRYADVNNTSIGVANQLKYSVKYPMLFLTNWGGSTASVLGSATAGYDSWGGEFNQPKSVYDPCPAGWRVPSSKKSSTTVASPWASFGMASAMESSRPVNTWWLYSGGTIVSSSAATNIGYQAAGYRNTSNGHVYSVGGIGFYWTATASGTNAYLMYCNGSTATHNSVYGRAYGMNLRCVKNWLNQ